ncbi:hypothetical protein [Yinghuangia seranimata]|uniref:hypothetical protein n=1 Tax=Yinghuangia seranimata TaxID=408067 RepID=UPI00248C735F|nr:hypothetical protein [Yinghuangia seranimata]MDI2128428.1 hypothetical protein [Yinghuangia seranimata]
MRPRRFARLPLVLAAFVTACALAGCSSSDDDKPAAAAPPAVAMPAARTAVGPAQQLTPPAQPGEVRIEPGPFTDRLQITGLRLTDQPGITGHLRIGSDVSDTLALEVHAAFYDADGRLVGTGTFQYQEEEEVGPATKQDNAHSPRAAGDGIDFTVTASQLSNKPASAVISVPVLVNE